MELTLRPIVTTGVTMTAAGILALSLMAAPPPGGRRELNHTCCSSNRKWCNSKP